MLTSPSRRTLLAAAALLLAVRATPSDAQAPTPRTRAERTNFAETSHYADVIAFLDSLQLQGAPLWVGSMGTSTEGRSIPYVIASRPLVTTPAQARRMGRLVVYVQGNIHAGEVEGKEALLALLRDLSASRRANVLDSIVLIAVPIYNTDGNEKFGPQARTRSAQNGPEMVGERPNGQGFDLNRDYIKAEAPETRASLALFDAWDPDVFVDLHTTDGSFHGYALTYSPSLNPAAPLMPYTRDSLLPELRRRVRVREKFETFDYGNFDLFDTERDPADSVKKGWWTYDHRPRFGTNYYGLRNRVAILSEAYSHDPFERRVRATRAFVSQLLSLVAERRGRILALADRADRTPVAAIEVNRAAERGIPVRSELTKTPHTGPVIAEVMARTGDTTRSEPGVPRGFRRTGRIFTRPMAVYDRFTPTLVVPRALGYALDSSAAAVVRMLRLHGVVVEQLLAPARARVAWFGVDSVVRAARPFQKHNEVRLVGRWERGERVLPAGSYVVNVADQPLAILAAYLLEPESDDGLATWNVLDPWLRVGGEYPVLRVESTPVAAPRRIVP